MKKKTTTSGEKHEHEGLLYIIIAVECGKSSSPPRLDGDRVLTAASARSKARLLAITYTQAADALCRGLPATCQSCTTGRRSRVEWVTAVGSPGRIASPDSCSRACTVARRTATMSLASSDPRPRAATRETLCDSR